MPLIEVFECCAHFSCRFHWSVLYSTLIFRNMDTGRVEVIVPLSFWVEIPGPTMVHSTERGPAAKAGLVGDGDTEAVALDILRLETQEKLESI